jgi:hypothetical protein
MEAPLFCVSVWIAGRPYLETMMEVLNQAGVGLQMLFILPLGEVKRVLRAVVTGSEDF